jgi:hypothetical protein
MGLCGLAQLAGPIMQLHKILSREARLLALPPASYVVKFFIPQTLAGIAPPLGISLDDGRDGLAVQLGEFGDLVH